jgi:pyruvate dehydrogenase E2 component (dihydrolipoamide acetyltransferase)
LLEVESDKTTVEVPALQDGILVEWLVASDDMVPVESAIARIEIEGEAVAEARKPSAPAAATPPAATVLPPKPASGIQARRPRASTAARAAARRGNIDLTAIPGSGRNGRITRADLLAAGRPSRATYHVDTPDGKIFNREWPALGPSKGNVLLIHGLFADSQSFTTLGRKLGAVGFRTHAVDLPGHGETACEAATLDAILANVKASLPPTKFHIVGHSLGAVIATGLQDHAQSLTLLSPAGCGEEINEDFVSAMLAVRIDQAIGILGEKLPAEAQASLADHLASHGTQLKSIASGVSDDGKQRVSILASLAETSLPVQAVFLRDDAVIPAHHALGMPFNVAVHMMPGASHLPHWRNPDAIAALVAKIAQ